MDDTTRRNTLIGAMTAAALPAGAVPPAPVVRAPMDGAAFWMVGDRLTLKLAGAETGGAFALMEVFVVPGGGPPPHIHARASETFVVLEGVITIYANGVPTRASAGTIVHAPAGLPHNFRNESDAPARMAMVIAPAGLEGLFIDAGTRGDPRDPTPAPADAARIARIIDIARRYDTTFLPPG